MFVGEFHERYIVFSMHRIDEDDKKHSTRTEIGGGPSSCDRVSCSLSTLEIYCHSG
jgi:hypothetical protein